MSNEKLNDEQAELDVSAALNDLLERLDRVGVHSSVAAQYCKEAAAEIRRLAAILKEADEYLDTNNLTSIGHGSILHRKFKAC